MNGNRTSKAKKRKSSSTINEIDETDNNTIVSHNNNNNNDNSNNNGNTVSWQQLLQQSIDSMNESKTLNKLIRELDTFKDNIHKKSRACSTKLSDLISLTDCNQTADQDVSYNMQQRVVDAKFSIGPENYPFTITFDNTDIEGDQTIRVSSEVFEFEEGKLNEPTEQNLKKFFTGTGIKISNFYRGKDASKLLFCDIVDQCIKIINKKYGNEDEYGMNLGWNVGELADRWGVTRLEDSDN